MLLLFLKLGPRQYRNLHIVICKRKFFSEESEYYTILIPFSVGICRMLLLKLQQWHYWLSSFLQVCIYRKLPPESSQLHHTPPSCSSAFCPSGTRSVASLAPFLHHHEWHSDYKTKRISGPRRPPALSDIKDPLNLLFLLALPLSMLGQLQRVPGISSEALHVSVIDSLRKLRICLRIVFFPSYLFLRFRSLVESRADDVHVHVQQDVTTV